MSHLPVQHKNETTPGRAVSWLSPLKLYWQAKLRSIDSCQNGICADYYQQTNNVGQGRSGTRSGIFHNKPDGDVLHS